MRHLPVPFSELLGAASELHSVAVFPKGGKNTITFTIVFFKTMIFMENKVVQVF